MIVNSGSEKALAIATTLERVLDSRWLDMSDYIIVIGGDGFLLDTVRTHGLSKTYLPINGGTLGFLLNDVHDVYETARQIADQDWNLHEFSTLKASFSYNGVGAGQTTGEDIAVNEVSVERMSSQTTRLILKIDGTSVVENLAADGLIVATSQGSTGYNFSAGGPVCQYSTNVMAVTAICPHHPMLPPFVVPTSSDVLIEATQLEKRPVKITIDGREYRNASDIKITQGEKLRIIYFTGHNLTSQLVTKILRK